MNRFLLVVLLALPAAARASVVYEVEPRLESLSVVLRLSEPGSFDRLEADFPDGYARDARAAFAGFASHPAVTRAAARIKGGATPRALARLALAGSGPDAAALNADLRAFEKDSGFAKFFAAHKDAYRAFVARAEEESLRAMSPVSLEAYFGRSFGGEHRFLLAPLFPEDAPEESALGWRAGRRVLHLRPRAGGVRLGFGLDAFERSVAVSLARESVDWLKPDSAEIREHLAAAAGLRALALDLGEPAFQHALTMPALKRLVRLDAVADGLREYEAGRARWKSLEAFYPRLTAAAQLRFDAAERALKAGDAAAARAELAAVSDATPEVRARMTPLEMMLKVDEAEHAVKAGEREKALASLSAIGESGPEVRRRMVPLFIQLKEYARAQALLTRLIDEAPKDEALLRQRESLLADQALAAPESLLLDRAVLAARGGKREEALSLLARLRSGKPDAAARRRAADLYRDLGETASARDVLQALVKEQPADAGALVSLASLSARAGDRAGAAGYLSRAKALNPDPASLRHMAAIREELGDHAEAKALLDALVSAAPDDAGLRLDRAALSASAGRREDALADLSKADELKPGADDLRRAAELYARLGDYAPARVRLDSLVKAAPADLELRLQAAELAARSGDPARARAALAAARALSPDSAARRRMARLSRAAGLNDEARALLDDLLKETPRNADLLIDRAELAARAGEGAAARDLLARAAAVAPGREERRRMALLRQELKDYDGALALLDALVAEKADAATLGDLGVCKVLAGRPDEAIADLKRAIALEPRALPPYLTLASIYAGRGDFAAELAVYDTAPASADQPGMAELLSRSRKEAAARAKR